MNSLRFRLLAAVAALTAAGALLPVAAPAGSAASTVAVSATVSQVCTIATGTMAFGAYDPVTTNLATDLNATGSLSVACTKGATSVTIGLDYGANAGAGTQRYMKAAGHTDTLAYNLFQNSGRTTAWDNASNKYALATPTSNASQSISIYGTVTKNQNVTVDSYADTVNSTINF